MTMNVTTASWGALGAVLAIAAGQLEEAASWMDAVECDPNGYSTANAKAREAGTLARIYRQRSAALLRNELVPTLHSLSVGCDRMAANLRETPLAGWATMGSAVAVPVPKGPPGSATRIEREAVAEVAARIITDAIATAERQGVSADAVMARTPWDVMARTPWDRLVGVERGGGGPTTPARGGRAADAAGGHPWEPDAELGDVLADFESAVLSEDGSGGTAYRAAVDRLTAMFNRFANPATPTATAGDPAMAVGGSAPAAIALSLAEAEAVHSFLWASDIAAQERIEDDAATVTLHMERSIMRDVAEVLRRLTVAA